MLLVLPRFSAELPSLGPDFRALFLRYLGIQMYFLCDDKAQLATGGFRINVSPSIAVSAAIVTGLQGNNATSLGIGVLGLGSSTLAQASELDISTYLANLNF
jgi:hypothetical protein